jgi:DNA-directed RNA polymerase subunit RPC12/RpoP
MYVEEQNLYRCEACGRQFDSERALRKHVRAAGLVD